MKLTTLALLLLATVASAQVARVVTNGLVGYYPFELTPSARVGTNNATLTDSPGYTGGTLGNALLLNGTSQFASLANPTAFGLSVGSVTAWVRSTNDTAGAIFTVTEGTTVNNYWVLYLGDGATTFVTNELVWVGRAVGGSITYGLGVVTTNRKLMFDGRFHHLAVTCDGAAVRIFIDGISRPITVGTGSNTGSFSNVSGIDSAYSGALRINSTNSRFFNGAIDELKIYNRALSPQEIAALANTRKPSP